MIIRSQDKGYIINFQKVDAVCLGGIEGKSVITFTNAQVVTLGTYSTEEKTIKVMDMIAEAYGKMRRNSCLIKGSFKEMSLLPKNETHLEDFKNMYVFQMPQDSEV